MAQLKMQLVPHLVVSENTAHIVLCDIRVGGFYFSGN